MYYTISEIPICLIVNMNVACVSNVFTAQFLSSIIIVKTTIKTQIFAHIIVNAISPHLILSFLRRSSIHSVIARLGKSLIPIYMYLFVQAFCPLSPFCSLCSQMSSLHSSTYSYWTPGILLDWTRTGTNFMLADHHTNFVSQS